MKSDLEIAREAKLRDIREVATEYGIQEDELIPYGRYMAKVDLKILDRLEKQSRPRAKYIDVTAINPSSFATDEEGEVYVLSITGAIFKLTPGP